MCAWLEEGSWAVLNSQESQTPAESPRAFSTTGHSDITGASLSGMHGNIRSMIAQKEKVSIPAVSGMPALVCCGFFLVSDFVTFVPVMNSSVQLI